MTLLKQDGSKIMEFTLTKEEFIERSMKGEVFIHKGNRYFYDDNYDIPFRCNDICLRAGWSNFNDKTIFTLEKPIKERRWRWQKDKEEISYLSEYLSDKYAKINKYSKTNWHKRKNDYIDVEIVK